MKSLPGRENVFPITFQLKQSLQWRVFSIVAMGGLLISSAPCLAQQLDTDSTPKHPKTRSTSHAVERYVPPGFLKQSPNGTAPFNSTGTMAGTSTPTNSYASFSSGAPLTATVTHTLYLPAAMYGQWNVTGTLIETNAPDIFSPTVNDIWLLEREGDQVTVTNPVNGAFAAVKVDKAEGDQATFHRSGTAGKSTIFQEIPTITVHGDKFSGQSLNKVQNIRNGRVIEEVYGLYHLEATRLSAAHARFHPEAEQQAPDLQIEEVR